MKTEDVKSFLSNRFKNLRTIHHFASPLMFIVLLTSVLTAFFYVNFKLYYNEKPPAIFMQFHQGRWSASVGWTRVPYTIFFFIVYLFMILTGFSMLKSPWKSEFWKINSSLKLHRVIGLFLFSFLFISATTGFLYRFLRSALGVEKSKVKFLMSIHTFKFSEISTFIYVYLMLILVVMLTSAGGYYYIKSCFSNQKKREVV
jgi:hypothetical protein